MRAIRSGRHLVRVLSNAARSGSIMSYIVLMLGINLCFQWPRFHIRGEGPGQMFCSFAQRLIGCFLGDISTSRSTEALLVLKYLPVHSTVTKLSSKRIQSLHSSFPLSSQMVSYAPLRRSLEVLVLYLHERPQSPMLLSTACHCPMPTPP